MSIKRSHFTCIFISFATTILLAFLIFAKLDIYPGGKFTLLTYDLAEQYLPFIASLRYVGNSDTSIMYSMFGELGTSYLANLAYYMASPLNLITAFVPLANMPEAIYCMTLLKLGLSSAAFCIYIIYGLKITEQKVFVILLSVAYGLSTYNVFYSMCLMWLDGVIMLPLILLGVEYILCQRKNSIYILCLTISLYMNYYITYMSGLFLCMYLLYRIASLNLKKDIARKTIVSFGVSSLISIGLSAPLTLPTLVFTSMGKSSDFIEQSGTLIRVSPFRIIRNLLPAGENFIFSTGAPQIYCGLLTLILVILFFFTKEISHKEKLSVAVILIMFFLSFMVIPFDRVWHGFRDPNCFPARYSFTFIAFMIIIACRAVSSIDMNHMIEKRFHHSLPIYIMFSIFICTEFLFSGTTAIMDLNSQTVYISKSEYTSNVSRINESLQLIDDCDLFRITSKKPYTHLDGFMFGYNDISYFSSIYNSDLHTFLKSMGIYVDRHKLIDSEAPPVVESLLGARYRLGKQQKSLDKNPYALPIGYIVNKSELSFSPKDDPFINQEKLVGEMLGEYINLYVPNNYTIDDLDYDANKYARVSSIKCTVCHDGPVFVFFSPGTEEERKSHDIDTTLTPSNYSKSNSVTSVLTVNEIDYDFIGKYSTGCVYIGEYKKGDTISMEAKSTTYYDDPSIVTLNENNFKQAFEKLGKNTLNVTYHKNGIIEGTAYGVAGKKLVISIPYMNGYQIYVDGEKVSYDCYNPAMISVNIPEGKHHVRISYTCPGLIPGIIIGITSLCVLLLMMYKKRIA